MPTLPLHYDPKALQALSREDLISIVGLPYADLIFRGLDRSDTPQSMEQAERQIRSIKGVGIMTTRKLLMEMARRHGDVGVIARPGLGAGE